MILISLWTQTGFWWNILNYSGLWALWWCKQNANWTTLSYSPNCSILSAKNWKQQVLRRNNRMWKTAKWNVALTMTLGRKWKTQSLKLITFVKGRLNCSCKSTTAANVDLTKSLLDNSLKNNHIIVDKIYYLRSLFVFFFTNFSFQIYSSTAENRHKNNNSATR